MRRLSILLLICLLASTAARDAQAQGRSAAAKKKAGGKEEAASEGAQALAVEPEFVFAQRGRRDPFSAFHVKGTGTVETPGRTLTEQDVTDARSTLTSLVVAYKNRNAGQFKSLYEQVLKQLGLECKEADLLPHALEIKGRAQNLKLAMDEYEEGIRWERDIQWAEGLLVEMQKSAKAKDAAAVDKRFQELRAKMTADMAQVSNARFRDRMQDVIRKGAQILSTVIGDIYDQRLEAAEKALTEMREKLKKQDYAGVRGDYDALISSLGDNKSDDPTQANKRERILRTAADIKRQAELGEVKLLLSKAKEQLAQMESTFNGQEYNAISEMNAKLQEQLDAIPSVDADMDDERAALKRKGADLERRAKICLDFLKKPPTITGIAWHKERPAAIINQKTVGIGDYIDENTKIKEITQDTVKFNYKGETIERPMMGP